MWKVVVNGHCSVKEVNYICIMLWYLLSLCSLLTFCGFLVIQQWIGCTALCECPMCVHKPKKVISYLHARVNLQINNTRICLVGEWRPQKKHQRPRAQYHRRLACNLGDVRRAVEIYKWLINLIPTCLLDCTPGLLCLGSRRGDKDSLKPEQRVLGEAANLRPRSPQLGRKMDSGRYTRIILV